jgi:hypothetical protein
MASLIRKPDPENSPTTTDDSIEVFHTITEWLRYPDGSVYPAKSWTSKRGFKKSKPKEEVEQFKFESDGEIIR